MAGFQDLRVNRTVDFTGAVQRGVGGNFDRNATVYYVNNITGSSSNGGLSWNNAVDEISTAITLSEASRLIHPGTTTNDYIRNTIVVQGTGTAYSSVAALPNYCDVIGLGADPRGNGAGIVVVASAGAADAMAGSARGLNMYNMQLRQSSAGAYWGLDLAVCFRSKFVGMVFTNNGSGGLKIVQGGGIVIDDCACTSDTYDQAYGLYTGDGTGSGGASNFNNSKIINSEFWGSTAAVYQSAYACRHTIYKDCFFQGGVHGFVDINTNASLVQQAWVVDCYGYGTHSSTINEAGFEITTSYTSHSIGCIDNANGTSRNYPTTAD